MGLRTFGAAEPGTNHESPLREHKGRAPIIRLEHSDALSIGSAGNERLPFPMGLRSRVTAGSCRGGPRARDRRIQAQHVRSVLPVKVDVEARD